MRIRYRTPERSPMDQVCDTDGSRPIGREDGQITAADSPTGGGSA